VKACLYCDGPIAKPGETWRTSRVYCRDCAKGSGPQCATRAKAALLVGRAIGAGRLAPPTLCYCADCGAPATEYDHRDYSRPLDVDPVCRRCNRLRGPGVYPERQEA
jgi:hypothetical protein